MALEIVKTSCGSIRGALQQGGYKGNVLFKKVPYAKPPIGSRRFKDAEPIEPWEGVYDATVYAPVPYQRFCDVAPWYRDFYFGQWPAMSEDCLYLSVYTGAESPSEKRPVYVWFHGGGLNAGWYSEVAFNGNELASKGVVVVSVGQRLNLFGYLALPQLRGESGRSGNYGFTDQIMALRWIRENIAAFGGDPDNITIGGQSGGSQKCCLLAGSPYSNNLFRRAILHSGLKWCQRFQGIEEAEKEGKEFLLACGIDPEISPEELRALPPTSFVPKKQVHIPDTMTYDKDLVPFPVLRTALETYAGGIDFMCGTNLGEADEFAEIPDLSAYSLNQKGEPEIRTREDLVHHVRSFIQDAKAAEAFVDLVEDTIREMPLSTPGNVDVDFTDPEHMARILASLGLAYPGRVNFSRNLMAARMFGEHMKKKYPAFRNFAYLFAHILPVNENDYHTPYDPNVQMAYHSSELFYAFSSLRKDVPPTRPWTEDDYLLADQMSSYWVNFIRYGTPSGNDPHLPEWGESSDGSYMVFTDHPESHKGFDCVLDGVISAFVREQYFG